MVSVAWVALLVFLARTADATVWPTGLNLARINAPVGIDDTTPTLRWSLRADRQDVQQVAFSIRVATRPGLLQDADVWASGRTTSAIPEARIPERAKLRNGERYCWQVRVWDQRGEVSDWSKIHHFSTGLRSDDWTAQWITPAPATSGSDGKREGSSQEQHTWWLRRVVDLEEVPDRVALAVVCLGYFELYVNGERVGEEPLAPSVTKLDKRGLCVTYEIRDLLRPGKNCIALACSSGWYLPHQFNVHERGTPLIRLQAYALREARVETLFGSDAQWLARPSNRMITGAWKWNHFGGEAVDGRGETSSWREPDCPDEGWSAVRRVSPPPIVVTARTCPPNRIGATYRAEKVREVRGGVFEVDFGRCLAGLVRLRFPHVARDSEIVMRFYDLPADHGRKKDHSYKQISRYVARGDGSDCFENKFNYAGFRYVTIEGLDATPALEDLEAMLVETANEPAGSFRCSNDLFNRIHELNAHTLRCLNLGGYHVDCPHRERNGYGADGQTALPAYPYLFDSEAFLHKWLVDWLDVAEPATGRIQHTAPIYHRGESPAWGGIVGPLAWRLYQFYGDREALEIAFPVVGSNLTRLQSAVRDGVLRRGIAGSPFHGDWVPPGRGMNSKRKPTGPMKELFNTAYLIYLWQTYADMGRVLRRESEVAKAESAIASLQESFHQNFFVDEKGCYLLPEQAYQAMPLLVGAVPEAQKAVVHDRLIDLIENRCKGHVDTGLPATTFLLEYLERSGSHDTIHTVMSKRSYPSWGYMLEQGATTIWEQWDGHWSQIHSCFAGPASWFYTGLAGIRPTPESPGFREFVLQPAFLDDLDFVEATYRSVRGPIGSSWRRSGPTIDWTVKIPPNSKATVYLPSDARETLRLDGKPLSLPTEAPDAARTPAEPKFRLPSGTWRISWDG